MARVQRIESDSSFNLSNVLNGTILTYKTLQNGRVVHKAKLPNGSVVEITPKLKGIRAASPLSVQSNSQGVNICLLIGSDSQTSRYLAVSDSMLLLKNIGADITAALENAKAYTDNRFLSNSIELNQRFSDYYTKTQIDVFVSALSDSIEALQQKFNDYYTKEEVDSIVGDLSDSIDSINQKFDGYYTKGEVDSLIQGISNSVDLSDYYTKEQVNTLIQGLSNSIDLSDYYTKEEVDALLQTSDSSAYVEISSVQNNKIYIGRSKIPIGIETNKGSYYPIQKGSVALLSDSIQLDIAPYLAYDGVSGFSPVWRVWLASGVSGCKQISNSADLSNYYTKAQVDALFQQFSDSVDLSNYYTKGEIDSIIQQLSNSVDLSDYYIKGQVDSFIATLSNSIQALEEKFSDYYTRDEIDSIISNSLPVATASVLGIVKPDGKTITIDNGVISAQQTYLRKLVSSDSVLEDKQWAICTANCTLTLPQVQQGSYIRVSSTYGVTNVSITPAQGDLIDSDSSSFKIKTDNDTVQMYGTASGWKVIQKLTTNGLPIGSVFAYTSSNPPAGSFRLNGQTITNCREVYPQFWEWVNTEHSENRLRCLSDSSWLAQFNAKGDCGAFVIDSDSGDIRLPSIIRSFIQGAGTNGGYTEKPGLPDIEGTLNATYAMIRGTPTGAFHYTNASDSATACEFPNTRLMQKITFKASRANNVYGGSTTVQPRAVHFYWCIQVFNTSTKLSKQQAVQLTTQLQGKADTDLINLSAIGKDKIIDNTFELDNANSIEVTAANTYYKADKAGILYASFTNNGSANADCYINAYIPSPSIYYYNGGYLAASCIGRHSLFIPKNGYYRVTAGSSAASITWTATFIPLKNSISSNNN